MTADINLLPQKNSGPFSPERVLGYTKITAIVSLILTVSLSLILFLLSRDPTLDQLHSQENTILAKLSLLQDKAAKDLLVINRVQGISLILKKRGHLEDTISVLQSQIPKDVSINAFALDTKSVTFTVVSTNASSLGSIIDHMESLVAQKKVLKKMTIQGLITDEKGGKYLLTISGDLL